MANYKVILNEPAESDLENTYAYISEQMLMPTTALRIVGDIKDEIKRYLSHTPHFPLVDYKPLASVGIRRMVVKKYLVFFIINEKERKVNVIHIIHGSRNWQHILSEET